MVAAFTFFTGVVFAKMIDPDQANSGSLLFGFLLGMTISMIARAVWSAVTAKREFA